ncbi:amidohydrolase [Thermoflavimicrobium daqui]|uniref:5-methylthioadenosine/S-adenosylhomocysteine deaminase n=1 Tax=Thermoflavimicrobium daqui TaxID=2137476 RepID=A0A364K4A7_9BACL|nr:amidohydrolase [Thermoflavimicrobium daqui]RAL24099.1 N-ethylammeline chlorohydrolase [Thermoflavimicrobium daqui]
MKTLIKNALILTMNETDDQPVTGDILIKDHTIQYIGTVSEEIADEVIQADGMVAMPGLINTHNHSPMSLLRAFSDDLRLMEWLEKKMLPAEARMTKEDIYWGSMLAIIEMIKSGTTSYADMYIHMDYIAEAVKDSGIRASLTRGLIQLKDDGGKRLEEGLELMQKWSGKADGRITTMLGPHAPYTCPPSFIEKIATLAKEMQVPIHIHLAETHEEVSKMKQKYGKTPTQYLYDLGLFSGDYHVLLAHGVHVDDQDISFLKANKGGIAHNPFSNLKLGCGIAPIKKYLDAGITVGIGTDGAGSASSLDLFKEMKFTGGLQKVNYFDPTVIDAKTLLKMATIEGAKLLHIDRYVGTLEVGKLADIILIDIMQPHLVPHNDIYALLAYSATGSDVHTSIIHGNIVMRDRKLQTVDEAFVLREALQRVQRLIKEI